MNMSFEKPICRYDNAEPVNNIEDEDFLETETYGGFRVWHILFLSLGGILGFVIMLCCCVRFRIPRTKQEIETEFLRNELTRKFNKHLRAIEKRKQGIVYETELKNAFQMERDWQDSNTEKEADSQIGQPFDPMDF